MLPLFKKIEQHFGKKLPFVVYSKPNSTMMIGLFQEDDVLYEIEDFEETGFAFVSFDGTKRLLISSNKSSTYLKRISPISKEIKPVSIYDDLDSQYNFENKVENAITKIKNGDFEKVVLSRKEVFNLNALDYLNSFKCLLQKYPTAFRYLLFHPKAGLWIGATPEKFLEIRNNQLKTMALAGTQLFSEQVQWTSKEKTEQKIVTEYIKKQLGKYTSKIKNSKPYTFQAGNLAHIRTDIEAEFLKANKKNIIEDLHPTPAVCGFPKEASKEFILENEGYDRAFYAGFLGELNMRINPDIILNMKNKEDFNFGKRLDDSDLYVNLRCMKIEDKKVSLFVGCGITEASNPILEFLETVNKSKTIKNILVS